MCAVLTETLLISPLNLNSHEISLWRRGFPARVEIYEADEPVFGDVVLVPDLGELADVIDGADNVRVFAGYAGWGPDQLDGELEREDWIVEPAQASDVFSDSPEELWAAVLERKGGQYALLARMPDDPSLN